MKKLIASSIITIMLTGGVSSQIEASNYPTVYVIIDGVKQEFDQHPVVVNDFTLVPLRTIFESLGAEVEWNSTSRKVTATKDSTTLVLTVGSRTVLKNGLPIQLDVAPQIMNGRTMVPLRFVSEAFGADVKWDESTRTVTITKRSMVEEPKNKLTVEQAVDLALKSSYDLKNLEAEIERSKEVSDQASTNLTYTPIGLGNGANDALARAALQGKIQADLASQIAVKQAELRKETLSYNVQRAYNEVLQRQLEKTISAQATEQGRLKQDQTIIKAKNGLASSFEETQAINNYREAIEKQELAVKTLDLAYLKLNQLLGLPESERLELSDLPTFSKLENVDVDDHVRRVKNESTAVWLAEKQVDLAQLGVDLYTFNDPRSEPYRAKEIDLDKARNNVSITKQQLDEGTRTIYNNIKQLENQYALLEVNLAKAKDGVKLAQVRFDLGMVTGLELAEAQLGIQQLEQQMFNIVIQLDNLRVAFEKPWVATGR